MTEKEELELLRGIVAERLTPCNVDPSDARFATVGWCPICQETETEVALRRFVLIHKPDCYWARKGIRHVRGRKIGEASGEFERYPLYEWVPKRST